MTIDRLTCAALAIALLAACQPAAPPPAAEEPAVVEEVVAPEAMNFAMPFTVKVNLSPAAAEKLAATEESVLVDVMYYGEPKDEAAKAGLEAGDPGVWLGTETLKIEGADMIMPVPGNFENAIAAEKVNGGVRALVNVYSARITNADNILSCGIIDETLEVLAETEGGVSVDCKLIEE
jgi:hypothetical protein